MNGLSHASRGNSTTRLESTLRGLLDRVGRLERRNAATTPVTVGTWILSETADGSLIATHKTGVRRELASLVTEVLHG